MNFQEVIFLFLVFFAIWLAALSLVIFRIRNHFRILSEGVTNENLLEILKKVVEKEKINAARISEISRDFKKFVGESEIHIQKVSLVRFNPFKELGGNHSFVLTLLDARDNGVIITGLHTRERTRVYVKQVKKGKVDLKLSAEEKRSLLEAQKKKL